jgi:hypothetical protein
MLLFTVFEDTFMLAPALASGFPKIFMFLDACLAQTYLPLEEYSGLHIPCFGALAPVRASSERQHMILNLFMFAGMVVVVIYFPARLTLELALARDCHSDPQPQIVSLFL